VNVAAALCGAVTLIAGLDLRTVQLWADRIFTMVARPDRFLGLSRILQRPRAIPPRGRPQRQAVECQPSAASVAPAVQVASASS
jgi:hypothetical protein